MIKKSMWIIKILKYFYSFLVVFHMKYKRKKFLRRKWKRKKMIKITFMKKPIDNLNEWDFVLWQFHFNWLKKHFHFFSFLTKMKIPAFLFPQRKKTSNDWKRTWLCLVFDDSPIQLLFFCPNNFSLFPSWLLFVSFQTEFPLMFIFSLFIRKNFLIFKGKKSSWQ